MDCYPTGGVGGGRGAATMSIKDRAAATMAAGYLVYRTGGDMPGETFDVHQRVRQIAKLCKEIREGVGENGNWSIDLHQRFDYPDAVRQCRLMEEYDPYLVEDPTRRHSEVESDDDLPSRGRRGMGPTLGLQQTC